ncbi:MAG TPA: acetate--CoA ligase family protein [Thermoanaerobaculia bacterium]|nr:acetate--CoA ligase family protein [Thermoanaerobaculia bacterium]
MTQPIRPAHPLDPIFSPQSVAIIGASRSRDSLGWALVHNLVRAEFQGTLYPVNPKARSIHSLRCYPTVSAIPDPVDLAVITVPRDFVAGVVDECIAAGVRGLVVITAGFSETGAEGRALEEQLRDRVREAGIRMVGPNCMGVFNTAGDTRLDATFSPTPPLPGSIGFVSQSGALGVAVLNLAAGLGLGLTQFASMGNKADVSGNDLLEYWEDDPATRVICMYLESFGNPKRFTEIAKRVSRKKPILVVKSGRTEEGARAASSHTGALAGADVTVSAFLEQCGVLRADTIEELFDIARAFERCAPPAGRRVGILTNAGGPGILATDACVSFGLEIPPLSEKTRKALRSFLPRVASVDNPVDMIASATADQYALSLATLLEDPELDAALAINVTPVLSDPHDILERIADVARGSGKPVLAVMMARDEFYAAVKGRPELPPVYAFPESAARALARLAAYGEWRRRPADEPLPELPMDDAAIAAELDGADADGYLPPERAFRVLELAGIPVARHRRVGSAEEAVAAAAELGFPVVLKAVAAGLVHKSELGAVALDLRTPAEVEEAARGMEARLAAAGLAPGGFLLQEMVRGGQEVIFGISTDPKLGPLLMFGLGGKYVEIFRDVRFGVTPLAPSEAREMVLGIKGRPLLEGVRGEAAVDLDLLVASLLRLARLATVHPRVAELDVNPFLAAGGGRSRALDARIRVATPTGS